MVSFWKLIAATLGERAIEPVIDTNPGPFATYTTPLLSTHDYFFGHPLSVDTTADANELDEVGAGDAGTSDGSKPNNKLPLPSQAPGFRWSKDEAERREQKRQDREEASKRRAAERKLAEVADKDLTYWATHLRGVSDQDFEKTVGKSRDSMLHISKRRMKNEEVKSEKIEQVCGLLALLKAHPAEVWLRWTRRPRKLSKTRRRRNRPERMPVRYLTEMVDGEMVTERITKATPLNRPAALRTPYPVLSAEQKEAWDVMAEVEAGMGAWDDNSSVDGADLDMSRDLLDYIASDLHDEAVELGQGERWAMPAGVTTLLAEADAELNLQSVLKATTKKTKVKPKASDAQDKKRRRDDDEDDDDSQLPVKKALKQRTVEGRAASTTTSTPPGDPPAASSAKPVASPAGYDSGFASLPGEIKQAEPEPHLLKRMKRVRDDFEEERQFRLQNLMQTKRRRSHLN